MLPGLHEKLIEAALDCDWEAVKHWTPQATGETSSPRMLVKTQSTFGEPSGTSELCDWSVIFVFRGMLRKDRNSCSSSTLLVSEVLDFV